MAFTVRMHFSINPKSFVKTRKTNPPKKKKCHTLQNYQTKKNYPDKKSFIVRPQNIFILKKIASNRRKFVKLNTGKENEKILALFSYNGPWV